MHIERWALRLQVSKVARWAVAAQAAADEGTAAHAVTVAQAKKTWAAGVYPLVTRDRQGFAHEPHGVVLVGYRGAAPRRVEAAEDAANVGSM